MMDKNEPAFPTHSADNLTDPRERILSGGMTLRDYFAGQALMGILANGAGSDDSQSLREIIARDAYDYADAMFTIRERGQ